MKKLISVFIILIVLIVSTGCTKEKTNGQEVNEKQLTESQQIETEQATEQNKEVTLIDSSKKNNENETQNNNTTNSQNDDTLNVNKVEMKESKQSEVSLEQQICYDNVNYLLYINDRFGFSIQYPEFLCKGEESFNGDGITLKSEDGDVELAVWGSHNVLEETIGSLYKEELNKHPKAAYKVIRDDFFVVSWLEGDKIFYKNTIISEDVINTFVIQYPVEQKEEFDPIVTKIYHSFHTTGEIGY